MKQTPEYELKLVNRTTKTDENQVIENVEKNLIITYKYYEIALKEDTLDKVNTLEEAEELVKQVKQQNEGKELEIAILEKYTQDEENLETTQVEIAKNEIQEKLEEVQKKQEQEEKINNMPDINGIKLAAVPITGTITSRYGVSSRIRSSNHTGLDIAAPNGTPIKVVAAGTVTCAKRSGAYGNLVKVNHGNGVETWYAHTSKMNVVEGQTVEAGEVIALVGSTGNSTGNHLHLEIRINGQHINPQNYLYH